MLNIIYHSHHSQIPCNGVLITQRNLQCTLTGIYTWGGENISNCYYGFAAFYSWSRFFHCLWFFYWIISRECFIPPLYLSAPVTQCSNQGRITPPWTSRLYGVLNVLIRRRLVHNTQRWSVPLYCTPQLLVHCTNPLHAHTHVHPLCIHTVLNVCTQGLLGAICGLRYCSYL